MAVVHKECNSIIKLDHSIENVVRHNTRSEFDYNKEDLRISETRDNIEVDVVIVGGGLVGCGIACQLKKNDSKLKILIIEENNFLIDNFVRRTTCIEQSIMRSPYDHQIAPDGDMQLIDFARLYISVLTDNERKQLNNALSGQRGLVPIDLFLYHTVHVINNYGLKHITYKAQVSKVSFNETNKKCITATSKGNIESKNIIVATGLRQKNSLNGYKYDKYLSSAYDETIQFGQGERVAIVGSGLTAGHYILKLLRKNARVTWIIRNHEEIYKCTDVSSKYFRSEGVDYYQKLENHHKYALLKQENKGSLMLELLEHFSELETNGSIDVLRNFDIKNISQWGGNITVTSEKGISETFDKIIDCTGLDVSNNILPADINLEGEYPLLNNDLSLQKYEKISVAGALASMRLGPGAKNIEGIRLATEILLNRNSESIPLSNYITGHRKI